MAQTRRRAAPVTWHTFANRGVNSASLAAAGQATLVDEPLDHPTSGEDYGPGAIVGLRAWISMIHGTTTHVSIAYVVLMVIPVGLTVPTVNTDASRKQNEKYVWAVIPMMNEGANAASATSPLIGKIALQTVRRFDKGDRLVLALVNPGAIAFGALGEETVVLDAYLRED